MGKSELQIPLVDYLECKSKPAGKVKPVGSEIQPIIKWRPTTIIKTAFGNYK